MEILVLISKTTNRLHYIFDLILKEQLGLSYKLTTDNELFKSYENPKFHYGEHPLGDEIFLKSTNLLFEHDIKDQNLKTSDYQDTKVIFPVYNEKSILPFDIFAASFFLVSRYEEYLPHVCDHYNRYQAKESILYKMNMLHKPLVNIWTIDLGNKLKSHFPDIQLKKKSFTFVPTYDVDAAWAYKNKGFFRIASAFVRDLFLLDRQEIKTRWKVIRGKQHDPFDTFDFQIELQKEMNLHPLYFILCGEYDTNDKNISIRNNEFQNLIKRLGDYALVGIHPSFSSYLNSDKMRDEITCLSKVLNREVTMSRQHFLRLNLPVSYQKLIDLDITDDYTMGYASQYGFRAGIADTFHFFDLEHDIPTNLCIHPFALMDGTLRDYLDYNAEESFEKATALIQEVKNVGGTFILLWHNETLSGEKRWKGWIELYRNIVNFAMTN